MTVKITQTGEDSYTVSCDDTGDPYEAERRAAYAARTWEAIEAIRRTKRDLRPVLLTLVYDSDQSTLVCDRIRARLRHGIEIPPQYAGTFDYVLPRKDARRALEAAGFKRMRRFFTSMTWRNAAYQGVVTRAGLSVTETSR
jgi:hypothetical protein